MPGGGRCPDIREAEDVRALWRQEGREIRGARLSQESCEEERARICVLKKENNLETIIRRMGSQ